MARQRFTDTQEISFQSLRQSRNISNTGTLTASVWTGNEYIIADTLTAGSREYFTQGLRLRFEVTPGDYYYIERGEHK